MHKRGGRGVPFYGFKKEQEGSSFSNDNRGREDWGKGSLKEIKKK